MDADGTLEQRDGRDLIRFERRLPQPVERVWSALTEPDELRRWWGEADVDLTVGGRFDVRWLNTDDEGNAAHRRATITQLDPPFLLETDGDPHGVLRFELRADGIETVLVFTSTLDLPDEFRTMTIAGWHFHLDALAGALSGEEVDLADPKPLWEPIHEQYRAAQ